MGKRGIKTDIKLSFAFSFLRASDYIRDMPEKNIDSIAKYLPPAIFFIGALVFTFPFLIKWNFIGMGDWELFVTMAAIPMRTIFHYHQFPFWNPYLGGGNILFAHPEAGVLSPFFLLVMIFGAIGGLKLQILISYFLGLWGSFLFGRRIGLSTVAAYLVSFVYFGSSYFGLHFSIGHIPFTHFCFLPWFLYFLLKAEDNWKYTLAGTSAIALMILGNGAAVPFLYTVFFSGLFAILYSYEKRNAAVIKRYIFSIIMGVLLAGAKFWPMLNYLWQNRWEGMPGDYTPLALIPSAFFSFSQPLFQKVAEGQYWGWHEYSAYISPLVIISAIVGAVAVFKKCRLWLLLAVFFFIFGLGHFSDFSLWNLISKIPGFSSIRSPARGFQFVILSLAVMGGYGFDYILQKIRSLSTRGYLAGGFVFLIAVGNFLINLPALSTIDHKQPGMVSFSEDFRQEVGRKDDIYNQFLKNRGSLTAPWLSGYKEGNGLVTITGDVLMEYVPDGGLQVKARKYTPNRVEYDIVPSKSGTIIFGMNYDKGWVSEDGREISNREGLLATDFGPDDRRIILRYRTPGFGAGLIISLLAAVLAILSLFNREIAKRLEAVFK
jgi:hypothetical protein